MTKFIVLVYSGAGTSPSAVYHTKKTLKSILSPYHIVSEITAQSLLSDPWPNFCSLLVMPGGRDTPYHDALSGAGNAKIKKFVEDGGSYLGICAGGYYGAKEIKFMLDDDVYRVHAKRELAFWPGTCEGLVYPGFKYQTEEGSRPVEIELDLDVLRRQGALDDQSLASSLKSPAKFIYYNGGGAFFPPETGSLPSTAQVVARYSEKEGSPAAVVFNAVGKGRTMMMGMHPEYSLLEEPLLASLHRHLGDKMPDQQTIDEAEANRVELVQVLLATLNVRLPSRQVADLELLQRPTRPLPQFLISNPLNPLAVKIVEDSLKDHFIPSSDPDAPRILKDANDTFYYHQSTSFPSVSDFLTQTRTTALSSEEEEDLNSVPKHVIVASHENALDVVKAEGWCPLWDFELYFKALEAERSRVAEDKKTLLEGEKWRYGDVFFYSEAVSSTQTMLEKNSLLVMSLPTPLISLANYQLAGRGRTSNTWLNPTGCLQASTFLTLPTTMAQKVVFLQYLHALAYCQALDPAPAGSDRDVGPLGIRLKWPNDIYAIVKKKGEDGKVVEEKLKMGGVLVNSNYSRGAFRITSGAGFNVLNRFPTTALVSLVETYNANLPPGATPRPLPTIETALAAVTAQFEKMLKVFLAAPGGGFEPFIRDYEDRWMHSDELVHITTTDPPTAVRISTITLDYGLLRTVPVKTASAYSGEYDRFRLASSSYAAPEFIDLQPDGNSFDILNGLIRRKN